MSTASEFYEQFPEKDRMRAENAELRMLLGWVDEALSRRTAAGDDRARALLDEWRNPQHPAMQIGTADYASQRRLTWLP